MNRGVSGLGGGELPVGAQGIGPKKIGRSKALGVVVTNKTSETSNSPITEAGKNVVGFSESNQSIEGRVASLVGDSSMAETQYSVAGPSIQAEEILEEAATTTDSSDDIASSLTPQQRKKLEEEKKVTKRGSQETEISKDEHHKVGEGQATGEREEGGGDEKRRGNFFKMLERMAREGQIGGLDDVIKATWGKNGVFSDVTDAYNELRAAQTHFGESSEELLKNLSNTTGAAATILYKENGPDIKAGFLFGAGTDETKSYRQFVLRFEKVSGTFNALMEKVHGNLRLFSQELDKLFKAIKIDIQSQESTLDPIHLKQIMGELYIVQICGQLKSDVDMLLRDIRSLYGSSTKEKELVRETNSMEFAKNLLDLTEKSFIDSESFAPFVKAVEIQVGAPKVDFLQRFIALIKRLPDKLVDVEQRQKIVEAGQEYLEQSIQEEEELNES